ncbi:MAG: DUF2721 domain-containing protein [Devosia sp.]|nr:DUF2721 domain-containing protein [Devosia sp.]
MLTSAVGAVTGTAIEGSAHLVQLALTPVFLLTAIAGFLNVFTGRLARVADRVNAITRAKLEGQPVLAGLSVNLVSLRRRTLALQGAVVLAGASGAFTCAATFTIFLGALGADLTSILLFGEFGLALLSLLAGLTCFVAEMLIASRAMIAQIATDR